MYFSHDEVVFSTSNKTRPADPTLTGAYFQQGIWSRGYRLLFLAVEHSIIFSAKMTLFSQ
jgi:hypothetical protein